MAAHEKKREISEKAIVEKEAEKPCRECDQQARMTGETQHLSKVSQSFSLSRCLCLWHPEEGHEAKRNHQDIEDERPEPRDDSKETSQRREDQISDAVEKNLKPLTTHFAVALEEIADQ